MNEVQRSALSSLCARYSVEFVESSFQVEPFDLPPGYVAGWVGPIYVGCGPDGAISS